MSSSKGNRNKSAINSKGELNLSVIESHVANDIEKDDLYKAEDDMKKRAVHTSKSYDEFKNFVACSRLQPIKKQELKELFISSDSTQALIRNCPNKVLNSSSEIDRDTIKILQGMRITTTPCHSSSPGTVAANTRSLASSNELSSKAPSTLIEFEKEWRYFCTSVHKTLDYLLLPADFPTGHSVTSNYIIPMNLRISPENICCKLCKVEMDSSIFGGLILALHYLLEDIQCKKTLDNTTDENLKYNTQRSISFVLEWMKNMRLCGGFNVNMAFLTIKQKESITAILELIENLSAEGMVHDSDVFILREISETYKFR